MVKFPHSLILREWRELSKFRALEDHVRSIVFYAEDNASVVHFEAIIKELTENLEREICYITSSPNDPILATKNNKIRAFYIGSGVVRTWMFMSLKTDILVMTMPDLETFHIKRSRVYPVHYVYIFHSIFSTHSYLRKSAIDNFDTVMCVGDHHVKEIRATESVYGLKAKHLVEYGYGCLDALIEENNKRSRHIRKDNHDSLHVLVAPSWGANGLLETKGQEIVAILLEAGYYVTVRPHPVTTRKNPQVIGQIREKFQRNDKFLLETEIRSYESLHSSNCMISDWSGVALEYAFGLERPVIFVDVPKKINNPYYGDIAYDPLEWRIRDKIGGIVSPDRLNDIPDMIRSLCGNVKTYKNYIQNLRSQTVFNIGKSGTIGARCIMKIVEHCKSLKQQTKQW